MKIFFFQLMVDIQRGVSGQVAATHVEKEENKLEQEHALTHLHNMVEKAAKV